MSLAQLVSFAPKFLYSQLFVRLPWPKSDFTGQTVIITGSNTGLGLEAARHIVRLGAAKVILAVRTVSKGEAAAIDILETTGAIKNVIEIWQLDLSSYASVKAFGSRIWSLNRLDAFIQNAGILTTNFSVVEGNESIITTNVVSATLLALLVLPKLRQTATRFNVRTRLSFNGSDLQYIAKFKEADSSGSLFDALNRKEGVDMNDRYPVSKLLLLYTVRELAARSPLTPESNVIITYFTPGACKTEIFRQEKGWLEAAAIQAFNTLVCRTVEVGSRTVVYSVDPGLGIEAHGAFLMDNAVAS
ncbi:NAD(P)-binding protein [Karstenula rhodostoma CBS 690.94]|uniref:NAD(P)-binding protein n=1 Tax=Karstenula rhodostoma CBS 690.94 TaxID=1392251 RepID=A0A9P4P4U0_9PLEO|nr:NAD(P)-binding protein [Karstenula rhodostoma CBS 690.94]